LTAKPLSLDPTYRKFSLDSKPEDVAELPEMVVEEEEPLSQAVKATRTQLLKIMNAT
jgi:hypothetical protein